MSLGFLSINKFCVIADPKCRTKIIQNKYSETFEVLIKQFLNHYFTKFVKEGYWRI